MKSLLILFDELENSKYKGNIVSSAIKDTFNLDTELVESKLPIKKDIMAQELFEYLLQLKEPVLVITDKPIINNNRIEFYYSPGAVHETYPIGYTSTFPLYNHNDIGLITLVTLHEVGHMMGLKHHERIMKNKKYCLMRQIIELSNSYMDLNSQDLCKSCKKQLE
jgi:predicted Zn-dependent protease